MQVLKDFQGRKSQGCMGAYNEPNVVGDSKADQCRDCASWSCSSARRQRTSGQFTRVPNCVFQSYVSQRTLLQSWGVISTELQNVETILTVCISSISPYKQTLGDRPWSESVAWGSSEGTQWWPLQSLRRSSGESRWTETIILWRFGELSWGGDYWICSVTSESHLDLQMLQRPSSSSSSSSSWSSSAYIYFLLKVNLLTAAAALHYTSLSQAFFKINIHTILT